MKIVSPKYQLIRPFCFGNIFEIVNMTNWAIPFLKKNVICLQFPLLSPLQSIVLNFNRRGILGGKFDNARIRNIILDIFWQNWEILITKFELMTPYSASHTSNLCQKWAVNIPFAIMLFLDYVQMSISAKILNQMIWNFRI